MSTDPFILADRARIVQFGWIGSERCLFQSGECCVDSQGVAWAEKRLGPYCFATTWLGPGWVFDPFSQAHWAADYEVRRAAMTAADDARHAQQLADVVGRLKLGRLAERMLWTIHGKVVEQKRSVVVFADFEIADGLWGRNRDAWPRHWRTSIAEILRSLTWLHVAEHTAEEPPLGAGSALLHHAGDLRGSAADRCPDYCPGLHGPRHHHYLVNIGRGFLGVLEGFVVAGEETGERRYDFPIGKARSREPTLRGAGKTGRLTSLYQPAKLGEPQSCGALDADQQRMLQVLVGETTRKKKKGRRDRSRSEPHVFIGNRVPGLRRGADIECPLLSPTGSYVGFNGNKKLWGRGYRFGTWLAKAGFAQDAGAAFLSALADMPGEIGLIVTGLEPGSGRWFALSELQALSASPSGRRTLDRLHLRVLTAADYIERWNSFFQWSGSTSEPSLRGDNRLLAVLHAMQRRGVTKRALAIGIGKDASLVGKILSGKRRCNDAFLEQAQEWLATQGLPGPVTEACQASSAPNIVGGGAGLAAVLSYHQRGWSVIPQIPREKRPPIRWKPFQTRQPTEAELRSWWGRWPDAGVALIAGPLSGVLVVDVDGSEAHEALIQRLGREPIAPKVLSGSRQPNRYHLFFRHPDFSTKAKATPWHPKLEFRGDRALAVLPPSLHKSGNSYAWAPGQSLDDLPLSDLPAEIIAALRPLPRSSPPLRPLAERVELAGTVDASPSTRAFLAGTYANGPGWNGRLFRAACDLHGRGMPQDEAEQLVLAGAQPWNDGEREAARRTIASAFSQPREPGIV